MNIVSAVIDDDSVVDVCCISPLMLNTQRLSSMAFNLRDGSETNESKLSPMMKRLAVKSVITQSSFADNLPAVHLAVADGGCFPTVSLFINIIMGINICDKLNVG